MHRPTFEAIFFSMDIEVAAAIYRLRRSLSVICETKQQTFSSPGNLLPDSGSKLTCRARCDSNGAPRTFATATGSEGWPESVPRVQHEPCNPASTPKKHKAVWIQLLNV